MDTNNTNISLDDISFDDMLGEGVAADAPTPDDTGLEIDDATIDAELADDAEAPKPEDPKPDPKDDILEEDEDKDVPAKPDPADTADDDTIVSEIIAKLGFETDEEYEDTSEGLMKLTQDMGARVAENQLDELFEKFPVIQKHLQYVLDGGDSQKFMQAYDPKMDYEKMEIKNDDLQTQRSVLGEYFKLKGHDQEFIDELLEDYQDSGKLLDKATAAKSALGKMQVKDREELTAKQASDRKGQEQETKEFWNGVRKTIDESTEFSGIVVPTREKSKFYDYISAPINKTGHTQRDVDHKEASMDVKLAMDYLMYKGFKLNDIINTKAKTKSAKSLRDKISKSSGGVKSARGASRRKPADFDIDDLDLNI
tara:strand:+ start:1549 stop:2652 length:1104 start_codon:yes stop_codon:yes gene_type:complete